VNLVGNSVIAPIGDGLVYGAAVLGPRPVSLFVRGNFGPHRRRDDQPESLFVSPRNESRSRIVPQRREAPDISTSAAAEAYEEVLASAGCTLPMRDAVDERIIADVKARRTRVINDPSEVGGWPELPPGEPPADADHDGLPDAWESEHGLNANDPKDGAQDADGDGYTNLEAYLNVGELRVKR
jgi:hypothetical protein